MEFMKNGIKLLITSITILALIIVGFYFIYFHSEISNNNSDWGAFGEYIGGVIGTLFNITAVILIYYTYKNSNLQQFELTFFNMLSSHRDIVKSLSGRFPDENPIDYQKNGYEFLASFSKHLEIKMGDNTDLSNDLYTQRQFVQNVYDNNYLLRAPQLEHYHRQLYHIINYVIESSIKHKSKYIEIIESQMSDDELYCNFYNTNNKYGDEKLLSLLDQYSFFKNSLCRNEIFDVHKRLFFPKTKFKYSFPNPPFLEDLHD
jgi:hypothetical protein